MDELRHSAVRFNQPLRRQGATILLLLLVMVIIIGMVACAVDIGRMVLLRAEAQNAVDAGALAAGLSLQRDRQDTAAAEAAAWRFVQLNPVGSATTIASELIGVEVGVFDREVGAFVATDERPNAVRVFARPEREPLSFGRIFGLSSFGTSVASIAMSSANPVDIMMVLDLSGSMSEHGRIEALQRSAPIFAQIIDEQDGDDQIGVMGLAANPKQYDPVAQQHSGIVYHSGLHPTADHYAGVLEATLTSNLTALRQNCLNASVLVSGKYTGWTGTGAALGDAVHYLTSGAEARADAKKFIVLMSDGYANKPTGYGPRYALTMARYAFKNDVLVYTISLGDEADVDLMRRIATATGGEHFDARGAGEAELTARLTDAFEQAALAIKRVQLVR